MSKNVLLSKFKGALVGAVLGDCIGSEFEGLWAKSIGVEKVLKSIGKLESEYDPATDGREADKQDMLLRDYTDDTAMARSVAQSLIENKGFDAKHMAKMFTEEYFKDPYRGYGGSIMAVFSKLKDAEFADPYKPAAEQFDGEGSYGNGGAMRIVPAPLFAYRQNDVQHLTELVEQITKITHSHPSAINGAIFQSFAVDLALRGSKEVDTGAFCDELQKRIMEREKKVTEKIKKRKLEEDEAEEDNHSKEATPFDLPYASITDDIRKYALQEDLPSTEEITGNLGTDISAYRSVPTAVYSFLRASKHIDKLEDRNSFEKTIIYAITLGGDTDTIATMAGAIAGAWYGIEAIPKSWQAGCESVEDALKFAEQLYELSSTSE